MSTAIIYHSYQNKEGGFTDCPDGVIGAAIAYQRLGVGSHRYTLEVVSDYYRPNTEYEKGKPNLIPTLTRAGTIFIVDFSYPRSWLEEMQGQGIGVMVIDHHVDKLESFDLKNFSDALYPTTELEDCGATLTWKFFYPEVEMPKVLEHIRRRDIGLDGYYEGLCPDSEAVNLAMDDIRYNLRSLDTDTKMEALWSFITEDWAEELLLNMGRPKVQERDKRIKDFLDNNFEHGCIITSGHEPDSDPTGTERA